MMKTFGLIPARGGSKGIPRKNIKLIAGLPLITWTIRAALASSRLDAVIVSTEDEEIAAIARDAGADVPFLRPSELAADDTPGIDPVLHALRLLPDFDAVLLLQPTSPLRSTEDIDNLLALAAKSRSPSIVSVSKSAAHPNWMYRIAAGGQLEPLVSEPTVARRQDLAPVYALNGAMYYARSAWLQDTLGFVGPETLAYPMSDESSVDIDGPIDWSLAELLLNQACA